MRAEGRAVTDDANLEAILPVLDAQCEDYGALYCEGQRQRDCLRRDDMQGMNEATRSMRVLMNRIQLRQAQLPPDLAGLAQRQPAVAERTATLRQFVRRVLRVRDESEQAARELLAATRHQLHQFDAGRRAARGYRRVAPRQPRFVDGSR